LKFCKSKRLFHYKKFNQLKINLIRALAAVLTLIFSADFVQGQTRPPQGLEKFENKAVRVSRLRFSSLPDTTESSLYLGRTSIGPTFFPVFLGLTNSGSLLAFVDSLGRFPIQIEKRRHFPFFWLFPNKLYEVEIGTGTGEDGYIAARLLETEPQVRVLDEIWICAPIRHFPVRPISWEARSWIKIKTN
jgi:hypothetical protein